MAVPGILIIPQDLDFHILGFASFIIFFQFHYCTLADVNLLNNHGCVFFFNEFA